MRLSALSFLLTAEALFTHTYPCIYQIIDLWYKVYGSSASWLLLGWIVLAFLW